MAGPVSRASPSPRPTSASPTARRRVCSTFSWGFASIASWLWLAYNFQFWILDIAGATPAKFVPALVAIILLMEAIRKISGLSDHHPRSGRCSF